MTHGYVIVGFNGLVLKQKIGVARTSGDIVLNSRAVCTSADDRRLARRITVTVQITERLRNGLSIVIAH